MTTDNPQNNSAEVLDEDNRIDKKYKDRIVDARRQVSEREDDIYVGAPLDPDMKYDERQLDAIWGVSVRQFLRTIEPLLRSDEIEDAEYYYRKLPLLEDKLYPPDGPTKVVVGTDSTTMDIQWSIFYDDAIDAGDVLWNDKNPFNPSFEPPEPKDVKIHGLKDMIETEVFTASWSVPLNPGGNFNKTTKVAKPQVTKAVRKHVLETAVRSADEFLQNAGVGLEVGDPTKEASFEVEEIMEQSGLNMDDL